MKLYYNKNRKDPTYYAQVGYRDSSGKATTRNVNNLGKHSELLKITDDPVAYCRELIRKMNEEAREGKSSLQITLDFNENVTETDEEFSKSTQLNKYRIFLSSVHLSEAGSAEVF